MPTITNHIDSHRDRELRRSLENQRAEILDVTRTRIRAAQQARAADAGMVLDTADASESGVQEELDFALIEMYSETLQRIGFALERLDAGEYGYCIECGGEISARRLEALPFAPRCHSCQEALEITDSSETTRLRPDRPAAWPAAAALDHLSPDL
jgi:DnaK suppressor protein